MISLRFLITLYWLVKVTALKAEGGDTELFFLSSSSIIKNPYSHSSQIYYLFVFQILTAPLPFQRHMWITILFRPFIPQFYVIEQIFFIVKYDFF